MAGASSILIGRSSSRLVLICGIGVAPTFCNQVSFVNSNCSDCTSAFRALQKSIHSPVLRNPFFSRTRAEAGLSCQTQDVRTVLDGSEKNSLVFIFKAWVI